MPQREVKLSLDISALRQSFGLTESELPDNATDEQINQVLASKASAPPADPPEGKSEVKKEDLKKDDEVKKDEVKADTPRNVPGGVVVDSGMWEQTQAELKVVREEREKRELQEDQDYLRAAVKAGKLPPTRVDHYMKLMKADRDGTREFVDGLPESLPVHEYGGMGELDETMKASDYPEAWLSPAERRRVNTARAQYADGRVGDVEPGSIVREAS